MIVFLTVCYVHRSDDSDMILGFFTAASKFLTVKDKKVSIHV
jgi:hypothetical protein